MKPGPATCAGPVTTCGRVKNAANTTVSPAQARQPRTAAISEPIEICVFAKIASRDELVRVALEKYDGRNLVDIRQFFTGHDGQIRPTKRGISVSVVQLPQLAAAINKALAIARDLGLIEGDS